jgi:hypothetical protein
MSDKLQQAIQATRAGDTKNAQFLLTQAIQEDPNNPQSWYLLSLLVDDKEKKQTYLTKVIEIDPDHTRAHEQLVAITETAVPDILEEPELIEVEKAFEPEVVVVLSSDSPDLEAQDEGETLPDWMSDDLPLAEDEAEGAAVETAVAEADTAAEQAEIPDWLEGSLDEDWGGEKETEAAEDISGETAIEVKPEEKEEPKEAAAKEKEPEKAKKEASEKQLNYILTGLIIVAIIIFIIMAYMIFTM